MDPVERALLDLALACRRAAEALGVDRSESMPIDEITVPVTIPQGRDMLRLAAEAEGLTGRLASQVEVAVRGRLAFRLGQVYCFQCGSSSCAHAAPPEPTDTFSGYAPTGKPEWKSFLTLCMERKEVGVERLYDDRPEILALVQEASELKGALLPGFGRGDMAYNVLGQIVAGWVPVDLDGRRQEAARVALTLQLVETRSGQSRRRLKLNVLGIAVERIIEEAATASARERPERLRRVLRAARGDLDGIGRKVAAATRQGRVFDLEVSVRPVLNRLRGDLLQVLRPQRGRTAHAQARHLSGTRPTSLALQDASGIPPERVLVDTRQDTLIVLGPKHRAHVFAKDGLHVTSLVLDDRETERKIGKKRWRPANPEEAGALQDALQRNRSRITKEEEKR